MKSPFPGMDPYIEACGLWEDFHQKLIGEIETVLSRLLPAHYSARLGERAYIILRTTEKPEPDQYSIQGDASVIVVHHSEPAASVSGTDDGPAITVADQDAVEMLALEQAEFREPFIEIRSLTPDRPLVTTIEVLSPSNKRRNSEGWELYERKRKAHLGGAANLVEIDLLRGGQRLPMVTAWPNSPYTLLVSRKTLAPNCKAWPASFVSPLPTIPVPLLNPDPDIMLSIQPMIETIYDRSRYWVDIDYRRPRVPPLTSTEYEWFRSRMNGIEETF